MSRWFRYYDDALNDLKVQRLPGELFKAWVNLMCLTSKTDGEGFSVGDIAFALRMTPAKAQALADLLIERELLDDTETGLVSHNWAERQFKSDVTDPTAAQRMKRYRKRYADDRNATVTVTPTRAETEQIQSRTDQKRKSAAGAALPADWQPSDADMNYGLSVGRTVQQMASDLEEMRLWAASNSNRQIARKADWHATFRGWMRRNADKEKPHGSTENLVTAAKRLAEQGVSFGPRPGSIRSEPDSNIVRLLPEGGSERS
jgi:hypothetical protein